MWRWERLWRTLGLKLLASEKTQTHREKVSCSRWWWKQDLRPSLCRPSQRFSQMASEPPSHTWWQETTFRVNSLNILGFSFSSNSLIHFLRLWACPGYDLPSYLSSTFPSLDSDPCSDTSLALVISAAEMKEPGLESTRLRFNPSLA